MTGEWRWTYLSYIFYVFMQISKLSFSNIRIFSNHITSEMSETNRTILLRVYNEKAKVIGENNEITYKLYIRNPFGHK